MTPDPFELEPSTAFYVPRRATVQALARMQAAIERDEPLVLLRGPAGMGKTLLLRLLRRCVEARMRCIELEMHSRSATALCAAALRELGRPPSDAPIEALARAALDSRPSGLLLIVDGAESLSAETLRTLLELAMHSPGLQLALAGEPVDGEPSWLLSPDPRISLVELADPMSTREMIEYLQARMDRAVAPPEMRHRLGWRSWPALLRGAHGNPGRLHHLARQRLAGQALPMPPRLEAQPLRGRAEPRLGHWLVLSGTALVLLALVLLALSARESARMRAASRAEVPSAAPAADPSAASPAAAEPETVAPGAPQLPAAPDPVPDHESEREPAMAPERVAGAPSS